MMRGVSVSRAWASTDFDGFKLAPPAMGTGPWGPAISYWLTKQQCDADGADRRDKRAGRGQGAPRLPPHPPSQVLRFGTRGIF